MEKLNGPFKDIIPLFQRMKINSGYKYNNINNYIELDNYLYKNNITSLSDTKEIFRIAVTDENNVKRKKIRYSCLLTLSEFMKNIGLNRLYLEKIYVKNKGKFIPNIISTNDMMRLLKKIDIESKKEKGNCKLIYPVLFRLIYSSGLRVREALNLKRANYNKEKGTILIICSKENITRNIPISDSMKEILDLYLELTKNINSDAIFLNINYKKVSSFFHKIIITLSLEPLRIHDLRHLFAITSLNKLLSNGIDEYKALYMLQVYLGHSSIKSTEYYLRVTKEYYQNLSDKMEDINNEIYKGIDGDENDW